MGGSPSAPVFRERLVRDWYRPHLTLLTAALLPLSWLFGLVARIRRALFRSGVLRAVALPVPVIVVGNVTVGGTGKTPLVAWLAARLLEAGRRPGIVSRGHGGSNALPRAVHVGDDPRLAGDEPLLLARTGVPVWIGRDRAAAARALLAAHPDVDIVISDDGLQHYRLARVAEIVVVDGERGFGNGCLLPAGPLREPIARVERADALVVNGGAEAKWPDARGAQAPPGNTASAGAASTTAASASAASASVGSAPANVPRYAMRLLGDRFERIDATGERAAADRFAGARVHAIAGIGNPERFFASLRGLGLDPVCHPFDDHHAYGAGDLALPDADYILMTDKDAIKCAALADPRMWTLPVTAELAPGLVERILEKVNGRQAA